MVKCNVGKFVLNCVFKIIGEECGLFILGRNKISVF